MAAVPVRQRGTREAFAAAVLFGAATPFASRLAGDASPQVLAGLLYLGTGLVLGCSMLLWPTRREAPLTHRELPALAGAIAFGGGLGPLLLMIGLKTTPASTASLLLNLEVVLTALVAWVIFHEGVNWRVASGLMCIVTGGVVVSWTTAGSFGVPIGAFAVAGACGCWAIDNNLTQLVSAKDPRQIATLKGLVAGGANLTIGLLVGGRLPSASTTAATMGIGVVGYGVSLMLFVIALRSLGSARTSTYFAIAPFVGVGVAIVGFGDRVTMRLWPAAGLMAFGIWLHLAERHEHRHRHAPVTHVHAHTHDDRHHTHVHPVGDDDAEVHVHEHDHPDVVHAHPHRPDIHHRHRHGSGSVG